MKKNKLGEILYFLMLTFYIFSDYIFGSQAYTRIIHISLAIILVVFWLKGKIPLSGKIFSLTKVFAVTYIVILIYSIILLFVNDNFQFSYLSRAISITLDSITILFIAFFSYYKYGKKVINIIFYACIFGFSIMIIKYICDVGFNNFISYYLYSDKIGNYLEFHSLGYILGMYFIYYLLIEKSQNKFKLFISIFYCLLIWKRIVFLAIIISIVLWYIINKFYKSYNKDISLTISLLFLVISFIYIWIERSGFLEFISIKYNIDFSHRLVFYSYFNEFYSLSPFYFGKTLGFTDKIMETSYAIKAMKIESATGLHNDILRYYIDLGMWGALYFYSMFLIRLPKRINKLSDKTKSIGAFAIISFLYICLFLSNCARITLIMFVFYLLLFCITDNNEKETNL